MKKRIGVVVLNYIRYEETIECVNSILEQTEIDVSVIIVDNGSRNESVEVLEKQFDNNVQVGVVALTENLGYAQGNNIGIRYLRKKGIEYICVANSDVIFSTRDILAQMICTYQPGIGVILPIVKNLDGTLDSSVKYKKKMFFLRFLKAIIVRQPLWIKFQHKSVDKNLLNEFCESELEQVGRLKDGYAITGSIFLLTKDFFNQYSILFPETFLYFEEWATIIMLHKAKLECMQAKTDVVIHKGGASTPRDVKEGLDKKNNMIAESARKVAKLLFMTRRGIASKYN